MTLLSVYHRALNQAFLIFSYIQTLLLSAILKHCNIDDHIYADNTQFSCSFEVECLDDAHISLSSRVSENKIMDDHE